MGNLRPWARWAMAHGLYPALAAINLFLTTPVAVVAGACAGAHEGWRDTRSNHTALRRARDAVRR